MPVQIFSKALQIFSIVYFSLRIFDKSWKIQFQQRIKLFEITKIDTVKVIQRHTDIL